MKIKSDPSLEIRHAQYNLFKHQILFLYVGAAVNSVFICSLFWDSAPHWLAAAGPIFFIALCAFGIWHWQSHVADHAKIIDFSAEISGTPILAGLVSLVMAVWAASLCYAGNMELLGLASVLVLLGAFGSAFCLAYMPSAAVTVVLVPGAILSSLMIYEGDRQNHLAVMIFLSAAFLFWRLISQYYDFLIDLVGSRALVRAQRLEAEMAREEATRLAYMDQLTGLPNRLKFKEEIAYLISTNPDQNFYIGILDLDGFKPVNDVFGHAAGDQLLCAVGRRLKAGLDPRAMVARLGGDEFGIIMTDDLETGEICDLGDTLIDSLQSPINIGDYVARISASIGFAIFPDGGEEPDRLIESADYALYHSKKTTRGRAVTFDPELESEIRARASMEQSLRAALTESQFEVYFQPIIDSSNGRITAYEALARWRDANQEFVSPQKFIAIAEETGLANKLCDILLSKALTEAAKWPREIALSFNISAIQFSDADLGPRILQILADHNFDPARLEIEITETALIKNPDLTLHTIDVLQSAGIRIALDDFGSGYASFAMIDQFPFHKLKIDQSLTLGVECSERKLHILTTIVSMCRGLEMTCVAEGVESPQVFRLVKELGCDAVQGFLFAKPVPGSALVHKPYEPERYLNDQPTDRSEAA